MHGVIFTELRKYIDHRFGGDAWDTVLNEAGLSARQFLPVGEYPDADAVALFSTLSGLADQSVDGTLQDFGEFIALDLLQMYGFLLDKSWTALDVIEHVEGTVHAVVRIKHPGASPPALQSERVSADEVVVTYRSPRKMCGLAKGIVRSLARHYGESVSVTESTCMLKGDAECRLSIRRVT